MLYRTSVQLKFLFILISLLTVLLGFSENLTAQKVRLRGQINPSCGSVSSGSKFADIYADGNIAVQGSYTCSGAFIYDISNPDLPKLSSWYNPGGNLRFLEAIVVGNRGYFGSGNGGGVHIVDLSDPRNPQLLGVVNSSAGNGHNSIHEMVVWGNLLIENFNGFSNKLLKVINISNPANPVFIRDINPTEINWVHAMHIRGNRMFTSGWGNNSNRGRTEIYDITDIAAQAPTLLGFIEDSNGITAGNNMHSSWSSEDGNYLYSCRETNDGNGDVRVYDIHNPAQPLIVNRITMDSLGINAVTPHNPVVKGNYLYVAWYQAGLQVFDISNPVSPKRVGQYDTFQPAFVEPDKADKLSSEPWDFVCGLTDNLQSNLPRTFEGSWAVFPFLGQDKVLVGDLANGLFVVDASKVNAPAKNQVSDFDGDGRTDFSTYSPSSGVWRMENSSNNAASAIQFGANTDKIVAGDFDGDGKSDVAVWRPSSGTWYISGSSSGFQAQPFGASSDIPVAADYDADGKTDVAVWRPSNGVWYILQSTLGFKAYQWGASGDRAFTGDYDGDGKADLVVFRPSNGTWYILQSSSTLPFYQQFGLGTDKPLAGDFDGDGKSDFAVFRPDDGNWYLLNSKNNSLSVYKFGFATDIPIPADYDGDGKTDVAVYRPENNAWYRLDSSSGAFSGRIFGQNGDLPSPTSVQP
ncbi:MAG: FG-GAP-like repeat-containing protein [Pyrinomonadaceae bacterium]